MSTPSHDSPPKPLFTIVSAVYNVARYLPEFMASIEAQSFDLSRVEVIMVDDGSTDASGELLRAWQDRRPALVRVLTKPNGGQGSARNLGLTVATGEWVTFTDPDDLLDTDYLHTVDLFLRAHPSTEMVATNRVFLLEESGERSDTHPLRGHFSNGDKLVDLDRLPEYFHGSAPAAFFHTRVIQQHDVRFDDRIRPNFEDGHFCCTYLLRRPNPLVGFLASAVYLYRKRRDQTSTLQTGLTHPGRYTAVIEHGYIAVLRDAADHLGRPPEWLQNFILYELSFYLSTEERPSGAPTACHGQVAERFHQLMPRLLEFLEPDIIESFRLRTYKPLWRDLLLHGWRSEAWHSPYAVVNGFDERKKLARVTYRYFGDPPPERLISRGEIVQAHHGKTRSVTMFDRVLCHERIAWVTAVGPLSVELDGRRMELRTGWPGPVLRVIRGRQLIRAFGSQPRSRAYATARKLRQTLRPLTIRTLTDARRKSVKRMAMAPPVQWPFRNAWALVDRLHDANDSAEHLFRYLRDHRPDINAWFVIEKGTPDWRRLHADGYGDRVVAYGSLRWISLLLNCRYLISSHIDVPIHRPPRILELAKPRWRFIFLQHGVIKDDLSNWLNAKEIALFVTSTPNEFASIAGDQTPYVFTTRETKLTGLPRFDILRERAAEYPQERRDLVLIAPTWRQWLNPPLAVGSQRRTINADFYDTDYARNWVGLLTSERLREAALGEGLRIGFLPHPNLQSILTDLELPDHVVPLRFDGEDVSRFFARAALLVTDYSSMAFNTAYIERPVVYFQFDTDRMFGGEHVGRGGYFDYLTQGFGPVVHDIGEAEAAIEKALAYGREPEPRYLERIRASFPNRDGRARERVVAAIESLAEPLLRSEAVVGVPPPCPIPLS